MPNFDDAICLKESDVRKALVKLVGKKSADNSKHWIEVITRLANFGYKEGLQTGYEIAEDEKKDQILIEVTSGHCITCKKFKQYYGIRDNEVYQRINCGFCEEFQRTTRPGNRCKYYSDIPQERKENENN